MPWCFERTPSSPDHWRNLPAKISKHCKRCSPWRRCKGFLASYGQIYTDVRIFNPLAPTNSAIPLETALKRHEDEKKRCYNERVLEVEQSSFCPLVFSLTGALGNEAEKFYRRLTNRLADKTKQADPDTIRYIRQRLAFTLLRTTVISLRGHRGNKLTATRQYKSEPNDINLLYNNFNSTKFNQF